MKRISAYLFVALSVFLPSCGSIYIRVGQQDFTKFKEQKLSWVECSPAILGEENLDKFKRIRHRLQCADIQVPLDWEEPQRGELTVSMMRVKAADQAKRKGAIFFNPGGPGGDGLGLGAYFANAWDIPTEAVKTKLDQGLKQMTQEYDFLGFSPRGTGNSSRLYCGTNELLPVVKSPAFDRSEQNIQNMIRVGQLIAKACQKNPMTPYINTDTTVQDMDLMRHLLGDQKLNMIGYSYGTWLGSWYAKRFPEQTGHILLDSSLDFNKPFEHTWMAQPMSGQRTFNEEIVPFIVRNKAVFNMGEDANQIRSIHQNLSEPLRMFVGEGLFSLMYARKNAVNIGFALKISLLIDEEVKKKPSITTNELLADFLKREYSKDADLDKVMKELAILIIVERGKIVDAVPSPGKPEQEDDTQQAVMCGDSVWNTNLQFWRKLDDQNAAQYPLIGGRLIKEACIHWKGGPSAKMPQIPINMPPVLITQAQYDVATYAEGAVNAAQNTLNAQLIYVKNEPTHGVFPYGTACVDQPVIDYFLTGQLPNAKRIDCERKPLPLEKTSSAGLTVMTRANGQKCLVSQSQISSFSVAETDQAYSKRKIQEILGRNAFGYEPSKVIDLGLEICD